MRQVGMCAKRLDTVFDVVEVAFDIRIYSNPLGSNDTAQVL